MPRRQLTALMRRHAVQHWRGAVQHQSELYHRVKELERCKAVLSDTINDTMAKIKVRCSAPTSLREGCTVRQPSLSVSDLTDE
jgi:hypothetical protein